MTFPGDHLIPGLIWGLGTAAAPWFVLFPAFGWGPLGRRAPASVRPLLAISVEHTVYGLGLAIVLNAVS